MFDQLLDATTGTRGAGALSAWTRTESAACARKVATMAAMLGEAYALSGSADRDQWCLDNFDAVAAHIGAEARITHGAASNQLLIAVALHERFPQVAAVFAEGLITYQLVKIVVQRGALVVDPDALHELDRLLAEALSTREPMSVATAEKTVDAFVAQVDPHAVRRTETKARGRSVDVAIDEDGSGMAAVYATLFAHDAEAFDARIDALARTVCPADPRTLDQRRADAIGALAHGADRLACLCDTDDCPAGENPPSTGVVVYVIASADTLDERPTPPPAPPSPAPSTPDAEQSAGVNEPAAVDTSNERAALDGEPPAMSSKPLRELTLTEALNPAPDRLASLPPAALMGGQFLPGAIARRATVGATITTIVHPGQAPPEPRYRPSNKLADFVRCREMTCRFPGCRAPATNCDRPYDSVALRADGGVEPEMHVPKTLLRDDFASRSLGDSIPIMAGAMLNGIPRVDPTSKPTVMRREVARILTTKSGSAFHRTFMAPVDRRLMHLTGGRVHLAKGTIPLVLLRTTGARSGVERDVPLTYFTDGNDVILVASNYGQVDHPSWYHNLLKNPKCTLFADGRSGSGSGGSFIASPTEGEDRDRLFALVERYASNYTSYAASTNGVRTIPVLRLTPDGR